MIDETESVQRYFTNRLFTRKLYGLRKLSYFSRLKILGLETLEHRRLINDLVLYYKTLNGHCDLVLNVAPSSCVTRDNNFKLSKQTCSIDVRNFFYSNRIVDAWNSLPNTVLSVSSTSNFKMKLREVNLNRFLTTVE